MAHIPANPKMWDMLIAQARAKFNKWPSPTASSWVSSKYTQMGGKFVESKDQMTRQQRKDAAEVEKKNEKRREAGL